MREWRDNPVVRASRCYPLPRDRSLRLSLSSFHFILEKKRWQWHYGEGNQHITWFDGQFLCAFKCEWIWNVVVSDPMGRPGCWPSRLSHSRWLGRVEHDFGLSQSSWLTHDSVFVLLCWPSVTHDPLYYLFIIQLLLYVYTYFKINHLKLGLIEWEKLITPKWELKTVISIHMKYLRILSWKIYTLFFFSTFYIFLYICS